MFKVIAARYGVGKELGQFVDVTKVVQKLASKNGLKIQRVSNEVLGLGAVFPGQRKRLWVEYATDTTQGSGDALERKSLRLPKSA